MAISADKRRVTATIPDTLYTQLSYWATKNNVSVNEYIAESIELSIRHELKDYDIPTMEIGRMNQLIDVITGLSQNIESLETVTTSGFDSLLNLTRGDNYLFEDDSLPM